MAKRFIDTGLFDDSWFMDLSKDAKLLYIYLITKCDHAGIIDFNERLCKLQTGINDLNEALKQLGNRCLTVREQYKFMPKFIFYQYPNFPNSNVRTQISAIERLRDFQLITEDLKINFNPSETVNEQLSNSYGNGYGNEYGNGYGFKEKGGMGEKTWRTDFQVYLASATEAFNNLLLDAKFISEREKYCPGVDISLTLEKAFIDFWGTENGWKYKKKSNVKEIDWKQTFRNAIDQKPNRVYKQRESPLPSGLNKRVNLFDENN